MMSYGHVEMPTMAMGGIIANSAPVLGGTPGMFGISNNTGGDRGDAIDLDEL